MATKIQSKYIADLAVAKTKEFKEVKEILIASGIVKDSSATVGEAESIAQITNALDDLQASRFIDVLVATKPPKRQREYASKRVEKTISSLESIKSDISDWGF